MAWAAAQSRSFVESSGRDVLLFVLGYIGVIQGNIGVV